MDKTAIKNYAVAARRKLIEAVTLKAQQLYIFEDSAKTLRPGTESERLQADGIFLSYNEVRARERLYAELLHEDVPYKPAIFNRVMESVACTWFNRLIALRIMEVNNLLPSNIRVLSSFEPGRAEPDAVREVERLDYVNQAKVAELRADTGINAAEKLYKYILISQCNELSKILPGMFEGANDYTELLLPDALLSKGGIVSDLINGVHEDNFDFEKQGQIEIIGWLYQFYISEKKDEVFAGLKKNIKINKDTIPAATQLFTPEWIVKYMVENSLGRLWLDSHPNGELRSKWKYYIDEAEQEPEVAAQLQLMRAQSPVKSPEDIKVIDPCMGSGHILVYAFDVLFQIYQSEGYSEREIPNLILRYNLHGLDIDDRAGQLAYFALMIKARSYNRRFFRQENIPQPKVFTAKGDSELSEYGSLIKVADLGDRPVLPEQISMDDLDYDRKLNAWNYKHLLSQKYDVAVTNPPYMAPAPSQADWIKKHYPDSKSDLCVVFIERNFELLKPNGYLSMITMHSWMFLSSYEKFREKLIRSKDVINMAHLGARAFEEIGGEVVQTTAFVMRGSNVENYLSAYARLVDYVGQQAKEDAFLKGCCRHTAKTDSYSKIPGVSIAYWVSDNTILGFEKGHTLSNDVVPSVGIQTGNNDVFLRCWWEIEYSDICYNAKSKDDTFQSSKWFPYNKGGEYRKWYGNNDNIVDWKDDGANIKLHAQQEKHHYQQYSDAIKFKPMITWSRISTGSPAFRIKDHGYLSDMAGFSLYSTTTDLTLLCAFCNSIVARHYLDFLAPTLNFMVGPVVSMPIIQNETSNNRIAFLSAQNMAISRTDWDSFETSWDFKRHPLVVLGHSTAPLVDTKDLRKTEPTSLYIEQTPYGEVQRVYGKPHRKLRFAFEAWEKFTLMQFQTLKSNEEELNRIFIDIYGLQEELTPEVKDKDVTVRKADLSRDIRSFLAYAVGCMFGRYSLDEDGLVFAGGTFDMERYKTFLPEEDNIIPIGSADYFDDDIVVRFAEFVRKVYGEDTLDENLNFIADALYPNANGTARERIRRYFLNDFYKDHVKIYQKRPIYWLLDSGKKDGFKALFYLHRYDKYTVARARTDYLFPLQRKYEAEIKRLDMLIGSTESAREKAAYRKEIDVLQAKIGECRVYDQVVSHLAHQQIELDLDDGVKVNYEKFQGVEAPKDNGQTEKMDLLGRI